MSSTVGHSQLEVYGDWYNISTGKLLHVRLEKNTISWDQQSFVFDKMEGKENHRMVIKTVYKNVIIGFLQKDTTEKQTPFTLLVVRQNMGSDFVDMLMECSDGEYEDTTDFRLYFNQCDTMSKMSMRFYNKKTIEGFGKLKPVQKIPKNELEKINRLFVKRRDELVKEFGEDKLLWIAPMVFQPVLTDILVKAGYNPMITEKQAEELFDYHYF
jgi:hypothetical protein